jgi:hypothetical protein
MPSPNPDRLLSDQRRRNSTARRRHDWELQTRTLAPQTPNPTVLHVAEREPRRMWVVLPQIGAMTSLPTW